MTISAAARQTEKKRTDDSLRGLTSAFKAAACAAAAGEGPVRELLMRATIASIVAPSSNETSPSRKFWRP